MPYVITTKPSMLHSHIDTPGVTRTAVATLDEARNAATEVCMDYGDPYERDCLLLPESGGTIGPLPDGTVIEVQEVSWNWIIGIAEDAGIDTELVYADAPFGKGDLAILAAYNAR